MTGITPFMTEAAQPDASAPARKRKPGPRREFPEAPATPRRGPQAVDVIATKRDALVGDADEDGQADPGDTLRYTFVIRNVGDTDAITTTFSDALDAQTTLSGTVRATPLARPDSYAATGNVSLDVPAGSGVLSNDTDLDGGTVVVSDASVTSAQGGAVSVAADGGFTYDPPAGFAGSDTFTYTVTDDEGASDGASVTLTVSDMLWFIDNSASSGGDGRLSSPFDSLAAFEAINGNGGATDPKAGDAIFIYYGSGAVYTGGVTLEDDQVLVGEGAGQSLQAASGVTPAPHSVALPATGGSPPTLANSAGRGITLAQNNALHGLHVGDTSNYGLWGSGFGSLTVRDTAVTGGGPVLYLNAGTLDAAFDTLSTTGSGSPAVDLGSISGSLTAGEGALTGASASAFRVSSSSADVTYNGAITQTSAASAVVVDSASGAIDFNGRVTASTSTATAINLTNNSGTVRFDGGLDATTSSGTAFNATGGGTVHVTGSDNALQSGTGTALNVQNTTIGADGLTFETISAAGAASGIVLNDTGTAGGLTVTGDGSAGSGGTIQNGTVCVSLQDTRDVSLAWMQVNDCADFAIRGTRVTNFDLLDSVVDGANGDDAAADEGSVSFTDLWGSAQVVRSTVSGGYEDNVRVVNSSGTLNRLSVLSATIGLNHTTYGNDGLLVEASGASVLNVTVDNTTFTGARGDMIQTNVLGSATMDLDFTNNTLNNSHPNVVSGGGGVTFSGGSATSAETFTYDISGNTFQGALGAALLVYRGSGAGSFSGRIEDNVIGVSGVADSGSAQASGIWVQSQGSGAHDVLIENNQVYQYNEAGITLDARDGSSTLNATVTNNTVASPGAFALAGIWADVGALSGDTNSICADIQNNTVAGSAGGFGVADLYVSENQAGTTIRLPGYTGGAADTAAVQSFLIGNNVGTPTASASGDNFQGGSACTQPSVDAAPGRSVAQADPAPHPPASVSGGPAKGQAAPVAEGAHKRVALNNAPTPLAAPTRAPLHSGETVQVNIGTLPAGKSLTLTFEVTVDGQLPAGVDQVCNQGTISGDNFTAVQTDDPDTGTVGDATCTAVDATPELQIAKDDGGVTAQPSNTILYTLSYTNAGDQGATGVVLTDTVPANTSFNAVASTTGWACTPNNQAGSTCTLTIGALSSGESGSATFAVIVANPAPAGFDRVENFAAIGDDGANGDDPDTDNNTASETTPVDAAPDLRVDKDDGGLKPLPGETFPYTLTYANAGDQHATGVVITEVVPANTAFNTAASTSGWACAPDVSAGSICTFTVGALAGGASDVVTFAVTVDDPLASGISVIENQTCIRDDGDNGADQDDGDNCDSESTPLANRAPTLSNVSVNSPIAENDSTTLSGQVGDPDASDSLTLTIDWGDGSGTAQFNYTAETTSFSETHQYLDDDPSGTASDTYTVGLTLVDSNGNVESTNVHVTVNNVPPSANAGADQTAVLNQRVHFSGRFTDTGTLDTHTVVWDFGDGVTATGTLTPSHAYTAIDVYSVTLTVTDDDGGSQRDELLVNVNQARVYVPLVMRNHVLAPDLIVEDILVYSDQIQVVIKNVGQTPIPDEESAEFWIDLYIDPTPAPSAVNQPWPDLAEHGGVWGVTRSGSPYSPADPTRQALPLAPGEAFTLTTGGDYWWAAYSDLEWPLEAGTPVYAQVDSANADTDYGAIRESHEILNTTYNNINSKTASAQMLPGPLGVHPFAHPTSIDSLPNRQ